MAILRSQAGNTAAKHVPQPVQLRMSSAAGVTKRKSRSSNSAPFSPTRKNLRRGPHNMSKVARRAILLNHPWVVPGSVNPHSVVCAGCQKEIKMDSRGEYYIGFWTKHTKRCKDILVGELHHRCGYTDGEAREFLDRQRKQRLQASRQARKHARANDEAYESDYESDWTDEESFESGIGTEYSVSEASIPTPVSAPATLPVARKEFHLNPGVETSSAVTPLSLLARAAFMELGDDSDAYRMRELSSWH